ncbi:MAG: UDP-N-acetylglucosamine 1-carboxyvinyltransferase [Clostridia bacterium]|nr:UDP-N-acetylglucosamine 1-carboxyvinyltransferase [Clostridia bacterium]
MEHFIINGGKALSGKIRVQGSKNGALPVLAAAVLVKGQCIIHNCPYLTDVDAAVEILKYLGCTVKRESSTLTIDSGTINRYDIPEVLMREMRSSIVFMGSVLGRTGKARMCAPGGCEIGLRPIDLHLSSLETLGVCITNRMGVLECEAPNGIIGAEITLSFPSVGATENIMLASAVSKGTTTVTNAAREPEIDCLADFLNSCGADIHICGDGRVVINGVSSLHGTEHTVLPDRIAAATFVSAAAATNGDILLQSVRPEHLKTVLSVFSDAGSEIEAYGDTIRIKGRGRLRMLRGVRTMPYPGFPTDAQAPVMAAACLADGTSIIVENIFESRFKHAPGLIKMGAKIKIEDRVAVIDGVERLYGARVEATDLRGGSALAVAGFAAQGTTRIYNIHHIDRGYEKFENSFASLGADIIRKSD